MKMKETSGIQALGNLYNALLKNSAPDVTIWSRLGSEHMEASLTLSSPLVDGRTLGRDSPLTFSDTVCFFPTSFSGLHQFQSAGSRTLVIIMDECSNVHLGPRPLTTIGQTLLAVQEAINLTIKPRKRSKGS
jgi:hypothetical protein